MTDNPAHTVLLAGPPGPLRDALHALLLSLPQVSAAAVAGRPVETLRIVAANPPGLVIVILERHPDWADLPGRIRAAAPACRLAVLSDGEPETVTADLVLQQGARPETLVAALVALLAEEKGTTDGEQNG